MTWLTRTSCVLLAIFAGALPAEDRIPTREHGSALDQLRAHPKVGRNAVTAIENAAAAGERTEVDLTYAAESALKPFYRPGLDDSAQVLRLIRSELLDIAGAGPDDIGLDIPELGLLSVVVDTEQALRLAEHPKVRTVGVMPDLSGFTAQSAALSDFNHVWNAGFDGTGVTVAVLDNGFSAHPALPLPARQACFCGSPVLKSAACCANS